MATAQRSVGKLVVDIYRGVYDSEEEVLQSSVANFIDIITSRVMRLGVKDSINSLMSESFRLRIDILNLILSGEDGIREYFDSIDDAWVSLTSRHDSPLAHSVSRSLEIYSHIMGNLFGEKGDGLDLGEIDFSQANYATLKYLRSQPILNNNARLFLDFIDYSIKFDTALILSALILEEEFKYSDTRELISILDDSVDNYAAIAIYFGVWELTREEKNNPMLNRLKIKASILEHENKDIKVVPIHSLNKMIGG